METETNNAKWIEHTRRMMAITVVVSLVIAGSSRFGKDTGIEKAQEEAEIVLGLMEHWKDELPERKYFPLGKILAGTYVEAHATSELNLELESKNIDSEKTRSCTLRLDLHQRLYVDYKDGRVRPRYILVRKEGRGHETLSESVTSDTDTQGNIPQTLKEFEEFWNAIGSMTSATVMNLYVSEGEAVERDRDKIIGKDTARYRITEFVQREEERHKTEGTEILILDASTIPMNWWGLYTEKMKSKWHHNGRAVVVSAACEEESTAANTVTEVVIPVQLGYQEYNWRQGWIKEAIGSDNLSPSTPLDSRLYEDVFGNLKEQTRGFSSLSLEDTQTWLHERETSRRGNIQFLGLELPREMAIVLGSIAIVILQFYTYIHLMETRRRLAKQSMESQLSNEPWVVLYEGMISWFASIGIVVVPAGAAAIAGFGDGVSLGKGLLEILATSVTVLLSVLLATCSAFEIYKIRTRMKQKDTE